MCGDPLLGQGLFSSLGAVMSMKSGQFYAVRVDDLKPICGNDIAESVDPDELIYLVRTKVEGVVRADMCIGVQPQNSKPANHQRYTL